MRNSPIKRTCKNCKYYYVTSISKSERCTESLLHIGEIQEDACEQHRYNETVWKVLRTKKEGQ